MKNSEGLNPYSNGTMYLIFTIFCMARKKNLS